MKKRESSECTHQIDINFQLPEFVIHNFCIVYHNVKTIKFTYCRLKCFFVLHIVGDIAMAKEDAIFSKCPAQFFGSIFTGIRIQIADRYLKPKWAVWKAQNKQCDWTLLSLRAATILRRRRVPSRSLRQLLKPLSLWRPYRIYKYCRLTVPQSSNSSVQNSVAPNKNIQRNAVNENK